MRRFLHRHIPAAQPDAPIQVVEPRVIKSAYTIGGYEFIVGLDGTNDAKGMTILLPGVVETIAIDKLARWVKEHPDAEFSIGDFSSAVLRSTSPLRRL